MTPKLTEGSVTTWVDRVLLPIRQGNLPPLATVAGAGGLALLSADADRIKDYVFESSKLPEMRGASMLLDDLNDGPPDAPASIRQVFAGLGLPADDAGCIIYAGGGSLLALVPSLLDGVAVPGQLQQAIESLYPQATVMATVTSVYQDNLDPARLGDFRRLMAAQTLLLRRRKEQRAVVPFVEALPHEQRCAACGTRPAVGPDPRAIVNRLLCEACIRKVARSSTAGGRRIWTARFGDYLDGRPAAEQQRYRNGAPGLAAIRQADDLEAIGQASPRRSLRNLIGFIYADGDGVGRFIEASATLAEYQAKSAALTTTVGDLVYAALAHHLTAYETASGEYSHGFEILTIGGDDLLVMLPAHAALPVALEICDGFARAFKSRVQDWAAQGWAPPKRPLTMSAGVVIAHADNPVQYVRDLAGQLLKSAKVRAKELPAAEAQGAIDFLTLKSQSMMWSDLKDLRRQAYEIAYPPGGAREYIGLTGRPYLLSEMARLLDHARLLRDAHFPHSQVQDFRRALQDSRRLGRVGPSLWYVRQQVRQPRFQELIRDIERAWQIAAVEQGGLPPWRRVADHAGKPRHVTIWEDLHEARELLPGPEDEPDDIRSRTGQILAEVERRSGHADQD
jgi:hypothetical protein